MKRTYGSLLYFLTAARPAIHDDTQAPERSEVGCECMFASRVEIACSRVHAALVPRSSPSHQNVPGKEMMGGDLKSGSVFWSKETSIWQGGPAAKCWLHVGGCLIDAPRYLGVPQHGAVSGTVRNIEVNRAWHNRGGRITAC